MKDVENLQVGKWYRVKRIVFYCKSYEVSFVKARMITAHGILPQDYAAFVCQHYLGERGPGFRTVAQMEGISMPPEVTVEFTPRARIELLDPEFEVVK